MITRYVIKFYVLYMNFNCSLWRKSCESRRVSLPSYIDLPEAFIRTRSTRLIKPCCISDPTSILKSTRRPYDVDPCAPSYLFIFVVGSNVFDSRLNERAASMAGLLEMEGRRIWINTG